MSFSWRNKFMYWWIIMVIPLFIKIAQRWGGGIKTAYHRHIRVSVGWVFSFVGEYFFFLAEYFFFVDFRHRFQIYRGSSAARRGARRARGAERRAEWGAKRRTEPGAEPRGPGGTPGRDFQIFKLTKYQLKQNKILTNKRIYSSNGNTVMPMIWRFCAPTNLG